LLPTRLLAVNAVVFSVAALLALVFGPSIRFGWRQLPRYIEGDIGYPEERLWVMRAENLLEEGGDPAVAKALLERSLSVAPSGKAHYLLAEACRASGDVEAALGHYRDSLRLDAAEARTYLQAAALLRASGREEEAVELLKSGIERLEYLVPRFVPAEDPDAESRANEKAVRVYRELREGLAALRPAARASR